VRFIRPTEIPRAVTEGAGLVGIRSSLRCCTEMTEFRIVKEICPIPAVPKPVANSLAVGIVGVNGFQNLKFGKRPPVVATSIAAKIPPRQNTSRANGNFGIREKPYKIEKAPIAQNRLSSHFELSGSRLEIIEPAFKQRESPAPTWIPLTIGKGIKSAAFLTIPITERRMTMVPTPIPAAIFSFNDRPRARATDATAFIGWTC
jgi:hypothetical protein